MKYLLLTILFVGLASIGYAETNSRSALHVGVSAAISGTAEAIALQSPTAYEDRYTRRAVIFSGCMAVGSFKEYVVDSEADVDDLLWDAVGCAIPLYIGEKYFLTVKPNMVAVSWTF